MLTIHVCVGSACHLKGAYNVITEIQKLIEEYRLKDKVTLKGSFCLGHCTSGVSVKINDEKIISVKADVVRDFFEIEVLRRLKNEISQPHSS